MKSEKYIYSIIIFLILIFNKYYEISVWSQFSIFTIFVISIFIINKKALLPAIFYAIILNFSIMSQFVPLSQNYLIIFLVFISLLVFFEKERKENSNNLNLRIFYLLFIYSIIIGMLFIKNIDQLEMFYYNIKSLIIVILFIRIYQKIQIEINELEVQLIFVSVCASLYFLVLLYFGITLEERQLATNIIEKIDVKYQLPDRNYASILLSYGFTFVFLYYFKSKKIAYIGVLILILGAQVLIASRAGILSSLGTFFVYILFYTKGLKIKLLAVMLLIVLILSVYFAFDTSTLFERFQDQEDVSSAGDRTRIWEFSFKNYKNQSIVAIILGQGFFNGTLNLSEGTSIHNNYLEILYDYGIIGIFIYFILFYTIFKHRSISQKLLSICFLLSALTLSPLMSLEFWFVFILLIVKDNTLNDNSKFITF